MLVHILQGTPRTPLPVPVDSELPAIEFPFGIASDDSNPKIFCVVDTGAGATCGNSKFFGTIAIHFPHIVHFTGDQPILVGCLLIMYTEIKITQHLWIFLLGKLVCDQGDPTHLRLMGEPLRVVTVA